MKTLTLQLPDTVDEKDVKMQLAAHLYDKGICHLDKQLI